MFSLKLRLNTCRKNKEGKYPLVVQLIYKRRKKIIYTPYTLRAEEFDPGRELIIPAVPFSFSPKSRQIANRKLAETKNKMQHMLSRLLLSSPLASIDDMVRSIQLDKEKEYVLPFFLHYIRNLEATGRKGSAYTYRTLFRHLADYLNGQPLQFNNLDACFIQNFVKHLKYTPAGNIRLKENSLHLYLRNLRTIYHAAQSSGIPVCEHLFSGINFSNTKTIKRAVSLEVLQTLYRLDLSRNKEIEKTRDLFFFSFFTRGMPFVDMAFLTPANIEGDMIYYARYKTKQPLGIRITPQIRVIIEKYNQTGNEYLLPILRPEKGNLYDCYRNALRKYNRQLKKLAQIAGLNISLSSYTARHSWATRAYQKGIELSTISASLGHTSERTTYSYLSSLNQTTLDRANRIVSNFIK